MTAFILTIVVLLTLDLLCKLHLLAKGGPYTRTPGAVAQDSALYLAFVIWGSVLLSHV